MKRARTRSIAQAKKRVKLGGCFFLELPSELRGEVRQWLDARERYRLHLACQVTYAEEPQNVFDFPEVWLGQIRARPPRDVDRHISTKNWITHGDLARTVWSLGWHRWRGLRYCTLFATHRTGEFDCGVYFFADATSAWITSSDFGTCWVALFWTLGVGVNARGMLPIPRDDCIDTTCRPILLDEIPAAVAYLRSLVLGHLAMDEEHETRGHHMDMRSSFVFSRVNF